MNAWFREALGQFCTGVTVVAAVDHGEPVGFTCQSFASLSLDPPLILFCPSKTSRSWPRIQQVGAFCVNILSQRQQDVCARFAAVAGDRFASVSWRSAPSGAPVITGVLAWLDCRVAEVHDVGDHYIVVGLVTSLGMPEPGGSPLLFHRGGFTAAVRKMTPGLPCVSEWI